MKPASGSVLTAGPPAARKGGTGRKDLLKSLLEIASALTSKEDLPGVLGAITRELSLLVPIDQASIALLEEGAHQLSLRLTYRRGETLFPTEGKQVPLRMDNPLGWSVLHRKPLWRNDIQADLRFKDNPAGDEMRSEMVAPLLIRDRNLGTLNLA